MNIQSITPQYNPSVLTQKQNGQRSQYASATDSVSFKGVKQVASKKGISAVAEIFKKGYSSVTDVIAKGEGALASNKHMQKFIDFMKDKNYQQHIVAAVGVVLSSFYIIDTGKSKTIEKDQKMPLMMNQGVVTLASTIGGYTLDNYLTKKLNAFTETFNIANIKDKKVQSLVLDMHSRKDKLEKTDFDELFKIVKNQKTGEGYSFEKNIVDRFDVDCHLIKGLKKELKNNPANKEIKNVLTDISKIAKKDADRPVKMVESFLKNMETSPILKKMFSKQAFKTSMGLVTEGEAGLSNLMNGLKIAKSLMVFGLIYRFVAPVIATPVANNMSSYLEKQKKLKSQGKV